MSFSFSGSTSYIPDVTYDVTDDNKNEIVDSVTTHIYKNFPNHTTEGIIS